MLISCLGLFFSDYLLSGDCEVIHLKIWRKAFIYIMYMHVNRTVGARHIYLSFYGCAVTKWECDKKKVNTVLLFHRLYTFCIDSDLACFLLFLLT